ncbi:putative integral membrane protein [Microbacterium sp. ZKA21]|uniref:DUF2510 domain-containing protein n=1 Tax=Microbacterium sp. ZKA21 TaxID=3381694 RepID=UPI003D2151AF
MPRTATARELEDIMSTPAGWYDDGSGRQRWWDGTQWTDQFAPETAAPDSGVPPYASNPAAGTPAPGGAAPYAAAGPVGSGVKPKPHILAWIALGVAALGFLLACIPPTVIVGLILLPIGLILSIVALFMKGAKWPAITGLILAVVGGIIGTVVLVVSIVAVGVQAIEEISDTTVSSSPQDEADDSDDASDDAAESGARPTVDELEDGIEAYLVATGVEDTFTDAQLTCLAEAFVASDTDDATLRAIVEADGDFTDVEAAQAFATLLGESTVTCATVQ